MTTASSLYQQCVSAVRGQLTPLFVFSFLANLLLLVSSVYMLQVFDRVLTSGSLDTLGWLTVIALVATAAYALLELARRNLLSRIGAWLEAQLSGPIISRGLDMRVAGRKPTASLSDLRDLKGFVGGDQVLAFLDAPWMPVFIVVIWLLDPLLGMIAGGGAVVLFLFAVVNDLVTRARQQRAGAATQQGQVAAQRILDQSETVLALGMGSNLLRRWSQQQAAARHDGLGVSDTTSAFFNLSRFVRLSLQVMILGAGAWLVLEGRITAGGMIAASIILARALSPVERSITAWRGFVQARIAHSHLSALFAPSLGAAEVVDLPCPDGRLTIDQVRYTPPGAERPVLRNISFDLAPGEMCGIVGPSGSGKSSLCRMVVGVWKPSWGHVRLDGADIAKWEPEALARHVGYLPQQVEFFPGTVAQNIARMHEVESTAVIEAARLADVHQLILGLPDGYDTDVGLHGHRLSGGQRQRLGLARALYGRPQLIVLDEPTASLDAEGERAFAETIEGLKAAGRTILIVTHHPSSLRNADKLLVVQDGSSVAFGDCQQVLAKLRAGTSVVPMATTHRQPGSAEPDSRDAQSGAGP